MPERQLTISVKGRDGITTEYACGDSSLIVLILEYHAEKPDLVIDAAPFVLLTPCPPNQEDIRELVIMELIDAARRGGMTVNVKVSRAL